MIILLLLGLSLVNAIPGRVDQGCVLLGNNVYCYGGFLSASGGFFTNMTTDHYYTDLSTLNLNSTFVIPTWNSLNPPPAGSPPLDPRYLPGITALDSSRYMLLGGAYHANLTNPGVVFNSNSKSWSIITSPAFYMSEGAMTSLAGSNKVWAYGGKLNATGAASPPNMLRFDSTTLPGQWTTLSSGPTPSRYGHAIILGSNNLIYFFGGYLNLPENNSQPNLVSFFNVSFYNTVTDQWGLITGSGDQPAGRKSHTATLIEGTSKVLIYGGTNIARLQALPLSDYAYTFDLSLHDYKQLNLSGGGAGKRTGHSAVYYNKRIFILFGYDSSGNIKNDTNILDVSNPDAIVWAGQSGSNGGSNGDGGSGSLPPTYGFGDSPRLSTGAIVGIVVAVVVLVTFSIGAGVYFYRKKKNQPKNDFDYYLTPPQDFDTSIRPTIFPPNDKYNDSNESSSHAGGTLYTTTTADPAPSYPVNKPHEVTTGSVPLVQLPKVKPSGND